MQRKRSADKQIHCNYNEEHQANVMQNICKYFTMKQDYDVIMEAELD